MVTNSTILIVDDTPANLEVLVNFFGEHDFDIVTALNGEDGLRIAHLVNPHIILLDVMMPGLDGFETCRRLKAHAETKDIPVIFMTALASEEDKVKGFEAGAVDYIMKPIQYREILARIMTHLRLMTLLREQQQQRKISDSLRKISRVLNSTLDQEQLLQIIMEQLGRVVPFDGASVLLHENQQLVVSHGIGFAATYLGNTLLLTDSSSGVMVFNSQKRMLIANTKHDVRWRVWTESDPIASWMGAPLVIEGESIGVLTVDSFTANRYDEAEVSILQIFANHAAVAIRNARLYNAARQVNEQLVKLNVELEQRVEQRTQRLEVVALLSEQLNGLLDFNRLLVELVNRIKVSFNYYHVHIYLVDPIQTKLIMAEGTGEAARVMKQRGHAISLDAPISLVAQAARSSQVVSVSNVRAVENWLPNPLLPETQAEMAVPIIRDGQVVGVLDVQSDNIGGLDEGDASLLRSLAGQVAVALTNARLFTSEQRQRLVAESLHQVAIMLNSSLDRDKVLAEIMSQLRKVIQYNGASVFLQDGSDLVLTRGTGYAESYIGSRISINSINPVAQVFREQQPILIADVCEDPRWEVWENSRMIRAWMGAPLLLGRTVLGVLTLDNFQVGAYHEEDVQLLRSFADQAATAMNNVRLYEEAQQANEQLVKLNLDKDKFFSILAHDLKGPFLPLLGNLELMMEMADNLTPNDVREMSTAVDRSARRVFELLENLLYWARLQMGRMEYQPQSLDLSGVAQQTVHVLSEVAKVKEITLLNEIAPGVMVYGDENMLNTIIRNLTNNALKFTPPGGQVTIGIKIEELGIRSQELIIPNSQFLIPHYVEVSITDTGVGMDEATQQKLFKIDQHVTTVGTGKETGTGLGLIICQELVIKSGGHIWVESELGQGTTVRFSVQLQV